MLLETITIEGLECVWCGKTAETDDHIFPRSLGGTLELAVPACRKCQTDISCAEMEVARRSEFALYRIDKGPSPRKKKKLESGSVNAGYVFAKDERLGGYIELALRAGEHPITLPCIEVDTITGNGRCRGRKPEDIDQLVNAVLAITTASPDETGFLASVDVELLGDTDTQFASNSDWWPRMFLDLRGRLRIRARDGDEATKLFTIVVELAQRGAFRDHKNWGEGEVAAGSLHHALLVYDPTAISRVVAKIACAFAHRYALPEKLYSSALESIGLFVRGKEICEDISVKQVSEAESFTQWNDYHLVMLEPDGNRLNGIVVLFGACFLIDLGENPLPAKFSKPIVAMSLRNGTKSFLAARDLTDPICEALHKHIEQSKPSEFV